MFLQFIQYIEGLGQALKHMAVALLNKWSLLDAVCKCDVGSVQPGELPGMCQGGTSHHQQITNRLLHSSDLFTCIERNRFRKKAGQSQIYAYTDTHNQTPTYSHTSNLLLALVLVPMRMLMH